MKKTSVVEQLKKTISELQLEVDNLHAQNLLLTMQCAQEMSFVQHCMHQKVHALTRPRRTADSLLTGVVGEVGHRQSTTDISWLMRDPVHRRKLAGNACERSNRDRV